MEAQVARAEISYDLELFNPRHEELLDELLQEDFLNCEHVNGLGAKKVSLKLAKFLEETN